MKLTFFVLLVAVSFALSLEKKNQQLKRTNGALLQALKELTTSNEATAGTSYSLIFDGLKSVATGKSPLPLNIITKGRKKTNSANILSYKKGKNKST
jgi:hypothetical protein